MSNEERVIPDKVLNDFYKQIGVYCPFSLAKNLGIKHSRLDMGKEIYGFYVTTGRKTLRIIISSDIPLEEQEDVMELLLKHHVEQPGVMTCISAEDFQKWRKSKELSVRKMIKKVYRWIKVRKMGPARIPLRSGFIQMSR